MSLITDDDVHKIAKITGLKIDKNQIQKLKSEMSTVIGFFESIDKIDLSLIDEFKDPVSSIERGDTVQESIQIEQTLKNAPESNKNSFVVPRIIKGS